MSRTLNLVDILLTTGRNLFRMGRFTEALHTLTKLAEFRKLPKHVLEELHSLLAEIHIQRKDYKLARRHLTAAIATRPLSADYHVMMAVAIEEDPDAESHRAEMYYQRAVQLEPNEPAYWADFGSYLFTIDKPKEGLAAIRKAYALGVTDVEIVGKVGQVLCQEGRAEEATTKLRAAFFHNHGASAFRQLWQRHQFELIRIDQENKHKRSFADTPPVILPFSPAAPRGKYVEMGARTFRIDRAAPTTEPKNKTPLPVKRPPRKG